MNKKILVFRKDGLLRFVGHLDVMRAFQRALRRADVPLAYSQGFNPHPLMSFASPLSLGYIGEKEVLELVLEEPRDDEFVLTSLNSTLPEGLKVLSCTGSEGNKGTAMSRFAAADYRLVLPCIAGRDDELAAFFAQDSIMGEKLGKVRGRKRTVEIDLKPLIFNWSQTGDTLFVRGQGGPGVNLNPELLCDLIFDYLNTEDRTKSIIRVGLLAEQEGVFLPLEECGEL